MELCADGVLNSFGLVGRMGLGPSRLPRIVNGLSGSGKDGRYGGQGDLSGKATSRAVVPNRDKFLTKSYAGPQSNGTNLKSTG